MPGAPQTIISQLNFNNVADTVGRVKFLCDEYPTTKVKVKSFMKLMNDYFQEEVTKDQETQTVSQVADATTQTDDDIRDNVEEKFELSKHLSSDALIIILETMWLNISEEERIRTIWRLYGDETLKLSSEGQVEFLCLLGGTFNDHLMNVFKEHCFKRGTTMEDLENINIQNFYLAFDKRL